MEGTEMAKWEITRSCGHVETVQIGGKVAARDEVAEYEATKSCYACYKAEQDEKRAAANAKAAAENKETGLPTLTGSEKQIAWAESIRSAAAKEIGELVATAKPEMAAVVNQAAEGILSATESKWWIDHRTSDWRQALLTRCQEIYAAK
jgi:hypothetical protein